MGLRAHLAEVHSAVFSADVLFALIVSRLGLRWDCLACRGEDNMALTFTTALSHTEAKLSSEGLEGTVSFSGHEDTTEDAFVVVPDRRYSIIPFFQSVPPEWGQIVLD